MVSSAHEWSQSKHFWIKKKALTKGGTLPEMTVLLTKHIEYNNSSVICRFLVLLPSKRNIECGFDVISMGTRSRLAAAPSNFLRPEKQWEGYRFWIRQIQRCRQNSLKVPASWRHLNWSSITLAHLRGPKCAPLGRTWHVNVPKNIMKSIRIRSSHWVWRQKLSSRPFYAWAGGAHAKSPDGNTEPRNFIPGNPCPHRALPSHSCWMRSSRQQRTKARNDNLNVWQLRLITQLSCTKHNQNASGAAEWHATTGTRSPMSSLVTIHLPCHRHVFGFVATDLWMHDKPFAQEWEQWP